MSLVVLFGILHARPHLLTWLPHSDAWPEAIRGLAWPEAIRGHQGPGRRPSGAFAPPLPQGARLGVLHTACASARERACTWGSESAQQGDSVERVFKQQRLLQLCAPTGSSPWPCSSLAPEAEQGVGDAEGHCVLRGEPCAQGRSASVPRGDPREHFWMVQRNSKCARGFVETGHTAFKRISAWTQTAPPWVEKMSREPTAL